MRSRRLKRIAALEHAALNVAGLTGGAADRLESIEMRLQFLEADAPVLQRHIAGDEVLPVALGDMALQAQFLGHDPRMHAGPVDAGAAHARARLERPDPSIGERAII